MSGALETPRRTPYEESTRAAIVGVVIELLDEEGFDGVRLREVARRARVSLATVYKHYATRDELIVTALEQWREAIGYQGLTEPVAGESLYAGLMRVFRSVFEPWEQHPRMLEAFHRASTGPEGERLEMHGLAAVEPVGRALLQSADSTLAADIELVLTNVVYAVIGRFADGEIPITDILPTLERTVYRLTVTSADAQLQPLAPSRFSGTDVQLREAPVSSPDGEPSGRRRYESPVRQQRAAQTRERIISAGGALVHSFPTSKWRNLTFRAVAEQAGVSERTVYRHFPTDRDLHDAVMRRLEQEAGISYDGLALDALPDVTARGFRWLSRFVRSPWADTEPGDPTLAADQRRRDALLGAVTSGAPRCSGSDRVLVAAVLDLLWNPPSYVRLRGAWNLSNEQASRAVGWAINNVVEGARSGGGPSGRAGTR